MNDCCKKFQKHKCRVSSLWTRPSLLGGDVVGVQQFVLKADWLGGGDFRLIICRFNIQNLPERSALCRYRGTRRWPRSAQSVVGAALRERTYIAAVGWRILRAENSRRPVISVTDLWVWLLVPDVPAVQRMTLDENYTKTSKKCSAPLRRRDASLVHGGFKVFFLF